MIVNQFLKQMLFKTWYLPHLKSLYSPLNSKDLKENILLRTVFFNSLTIHVCCKGVSRRLTDWMMQKAFLTSLNYENQNNTFLITFPPPMNANMTVNNKRVCGAGSCKISQREWWFAIKKSMIQLSVFRWFAQNFV